MKKYTTTLITLLCAFNLFAENSLEEKALAGDAQAQYQLAFEYMNPAEDIDKAKDIKLAFNWYSKAYENGNKKALAGLFFSSIFRNETKEFYEDIYKKVLENKDALCLWLITRTSVVDELNLNKDELLKQVELWADESDDCDAFVYEDLADKYLMNFIKITEADVKKAIEYIKKAENVGSLNAKIALAYCYYIGKGVEQNSEKAHKLLYSVRNAKSDYNKNMLLLVENNMSGINNAKSLEELRYFAKSFNPYMRASGLNAIFEKDSAKTIFYLEKACELNDLMSKIELADIYYNRINDYKKAYALYLDIAENHKDSDLYYAASALERIGNMYLHGRYLEKDPAKAIEFYKKAYEIDKRSTALDLGRIYFEGVYLPKDYDKAFKYLSEAEKRVRSCGLYKMLGNSYENGYGTAIDLEKALIYYKKAYELVSYNASMQAPYKKKIEEIKLKLAKQ